MHPALRGCSCVSRGVLEGPCSAWPPAAQHLRMSHHTLNREQDGCQGRGLHAWPFLSTLRTAPLTSRPNSGQTWAKLGPNSGQNRGFPTSLTNPRPRTERLSTDCSSVIHCFTVQVYGASNPISVSSLASIPDGANRATAADRRLLNEQLEVLCSTFSPFGEQQSSRPQSGIR